MTITHKAALMAADVLAGYCEERFTGKVGDCKPCIFKVTKEKQKPQCVLQFFLGFCGADLQMLSDTAVRLKCKELMENECSKSL